MARSPALSYLALAIVGFGLTAWLGHKIVLADATLANPQPVVASLALVACIILCATGLFFGMAFLFLRRFVAQVHHDGTTIALVSVSGQVLALAEELRIIKQIGNPYDFNTPASTLYTVFSADRRWWVTPSATISGTKSNPSSR